jgi:hypothetical protein
MNSGQEPGPAQAHPPETPPPPDAPRVKHATFLIGRGYKLVRVRPCSKAPAETGWNKQPISTKEEATAAYQTRPNDNIGVVLDQSGLGSLDIDHLERAREALGALGIDLDALLDDSAIPRIEGDPAKARLLFKVPANTKLPTRRLMVPDGADKGMVLELRSEGVQDIFPPSVHPSGSSYRWIRAPWDVDGLPDPPPLLLDLWTNWDKSLPLLMESVDPQGFKKELETTAAEYRLRVAEDTDWDEIREQIRQQVTPAELLSRHGIYPVRPNGYLCPFHQESRASFWLHKDLWICAHGSAPVGFVSRKGLAVGDVIDLYQYFEQIDSPGKATSSLAQQLGITPPYSSLPSANTATNHTFGSFGSENPTRKNQNQWSEPSPIPNDTFKATPFEYDFLPDTFRPWIEDISERMQCPPDYPAVCALIALSGLVGRQVVIRPKRLDEWQVVPNLWGGIVGPPSRLKSPALMDALRPLIPLERAARAEYEQQQLDYAAEKMVAEIEQENMTRTLKGHVKDEKKDAFATAQDFLAQEGAPPTERRYRTNDTTVEKLGELLNQNPRGLLLVRDELQGFFRNLDKPGHETDRSFYMEGWSGNSSFTFDRIKRGTVYIDAVCVSILGTIQPGPLTAYMAEARKQGAADDGLMQRFQMLVWPETSTTWQQVDRVPDHKAREAVEDAFRRLDRLAPDRIGAEQPDDIEGLPFLRFTQEAQQQFDHWHAGLEHRLLKQDLEPVMESHLAKYRSLVPSIALLLHLVDGAGGPVKAESMYRAAAWVDYLETHALKMYSYRPDATIFGAQVLATRIKGGALSSPFRSRDLKRKKWSGLTNPTTVDDAVALLEELGWLKRTSQATGGRPTDLFTINPLIIQSPRG